MTHDQANPAGIRVHLPVARSDEMPKSNPILPAWLPHREAIRVIPRLFRAVDGAAFGIPCINLAISTNKPRYRAYMEQKYAPVPAAPDEAPP
jgi:hypothetical protein